jgi:putative tricarboxylic transport membrane protein
MKLTDALLGMLSACLGLAMVIIALGFPAFPGQPYGASLLPTLLGVGFVVTGACLIVRDVRLRRAKIKPADPIASLISPLRSREGTISGGLMIATVLAHIFLAPIVGFIPVSLVTLFALFLWFRISLWTAVAVSIAGTAMCWIFFAVLLKVPLPRGPFEGIL